MAEVNGEGGGGPRGTRESCPNPTFLRDLHLKGFPTSHKVSTRGIRELQTNEVAASEQGSGCHEAERARRGLTEGSQSTQGRQELAEGHHLGI